MRSELESLREIERCARGVVRTAARDEIYGAVVPVWWKALIDALEDPGGWKEEIEEEDPPIHHIHMNARGFWEGENGGWDEPDLGGES